MKGGWKILLLGVELAVLAVVVLAATASWWPASWSLVQLTPGLIPYLFPGAVLGILFWWKRNRLYTASHIIMLLLLAPQLPAYVQWSPASAEKADFEVMTFNVAQFQKDTALEQGIAQVIRETNPDIVCLQEFGLFRTWPHMDSAAAAFSRAIGYPYYHFTRWDYDVFGVCIFSRHPILQDESLYLSPYNTNAGGLYTLQVGQQKLAIVNLHLASFNLANDLDLQKGALPAFNHFCELISERTAEQETQLKNAMEHAASTKLPTLVVGDFNSLAKSRVYALLDSDFTDSFCARGNGFGGSLNKGLPIRIDYQWAGSGIEVVAHRVLATGDLSDHYPIVASYRFQNSQ